MELRKSNLAFVRVAIGTLLLVSGAAFAQPEVKALPPNVPAQPAQPAQPTTTGDDNVGLSFQVSPSLWIEKEKHEFGNIDDTSPVNTTFKFKNTGTGPLTISDVHGSCGCTVPKLAKSSYHPGEAGEFTVTFNPHGKKGPQNQTVTITSNDPQRASRQVTISANVSPMVSVEPPVLQFGQVQKNQGKKMTVKVIGKYPNFAATSATVNDPKLLEAKIVKTTPVKTPEGADAFESEIEVALLPGAPVGNSQGTISVRTTKEDRVMNVTVLGEIIGDLKCEPARVALGALVVGSDINTVVKLTHREGKDFKIVKIEEQPAQGDKVLDLKVSQDDTAKGNAYTLTIGGKAPAAPGSLRGEILITTDIETEGVVKLSYFGYARADTPPQPGQPGTGPIASPGAQPPVKMVPEIKPVPAPAPK